MPRRLTRRTAALAAAVLLPALLAVPGASTASADRPEPAVADRAAIAPRPLIWDRDFGDPSVVRDGEHWYGAATGFRGRAARSDYDWGNWDRGGDVLNGRPTWAKFAGVWGPEVEQTPTGFVAYFTMPSRGLPHEQDRCIGVATAPDLSSTFTVLGNKPLVCPDYSTTTPAFDPVPGRVGLPRRGVIDPSSYIAPDGRRFLLYRTQGTPSTIRMIRLNAGGTATFGRSRELIRDSGVLENPVMVADRGWHYLITSRGDYGDCRYRTIWRRSASLTKGWQGTRGHALLNRRNTGVCGPGGADYVPETDTRGQPDVLPRLGLQGHQPALLPVLPGAPGLRGRRQAGPVRRPAEVDQGRPVDRGVRPGAGPAPAAGAHADRDTHAGALPDSDAEPDRDADADSHGDDDSDADPESDRDAHPLSRPGTPVRLTTADRALPCTSPPPTGHSRAVQRPAWCTAMPGRPDSRARACPVTRFTRTSVPGRRRSQRARACPVSPGRGAPARRRGRDPAARRRSG